MAPIDWDRPEIPVKTQAELLNLNRSSFYCKPAGVMLEEVGLKRRIDGVNRKAVQHHMREIGIAGVCPGPNLSKRNHEHQMYPYLLRGVKANHSDHV